MPETPKHVEQPLRVLFLCTHNSSRSQMAEGLLRTRGGSAWSKTIEGSSSATIPCMGSETFTPQRVSVVTRDEVRNYLHPRNTVGEPASRSEQRQAFLDRLVALKASIQVAL